MLSWPPVMATALNMRHFDMLCGSYPTKLTYYYNHRKKMISYNIYSNLAFECGCSESLANAHARCKDSSYSNNFVVSSESPS